MQKTVYRASHKKAENKKMSEMVLFLKSVIIHLAVYIVVCIAALYMEIDNNLLLPVCLCTFCFSSFLSGFAVGRTKRNNGLINGIIYSLPATVIFIFTSMCLNGFKVDFILAISVLCMVIFSAVGGVISVNVRKKTKIKK